MKIPRHFIIHGHQINVIQKEIDLEDNRYGYYDSVKEEIVLFTKVKTNGEPITLSQTQLEATFWHELIHCFQWHIKGTTDEWEAQSYSGLMVEFIRSSQVKINPNEIVVDKPKMYDDDL